MEFKVSVIIPVYNAAAFLEASVASALSHPEVEEVILVEDGSKDNSLAVCETLVENNPVVKLFRHSAGVNKGAGESRNLGIQKATAPFIAFLDSDDVYFANRFKTAISMFEKDATLHGTYAQVLMMNEATGKNKLFGITRDVSSQDLFTYILRGGYFHTNSLTLRRGALDGLDRLFVQYCWPHEDVELWLRLAFHMKLASIQEGEPVASYRLHGANNIMTEASLRSRRRLWATVFQYFFHKKIGAFNRILILKQMLRYRLQSSPPNNK